MSDESVFKLTHDLQLANPLYVKNDGTLETQLLIVKYLKEISTNTAFIITLLSAIESETSEMNDRIKIIKDILETVFDGSALKVVI